MSAVVYSAASAGTGYNFGQLQSASVAGFVYADVNNNSTLDSGEALAGVTLTLTGTTDQGAVINTTTTTDSTGAYSFTGLRPSNGTGYTVTETQPSGYGDFSTNTGTSAGTISGTQTGTAALNATSAIVLSSGASAINYNFRENSSSIAGTVYIDVNLNGSLDAADTRMAGVTVTLSGTTSTAVDICTLISCTTTTNASGNYSFSKLLSGTYTVTETQPSGVGDFPGAAGTAAGSAGGTVALNNTSAIPLGAGVAGTGYNFREENISTLSGKVYVDANNNGSYDAGETALPNITIALSGTTTGGTDICTLHSCATTTDASGNYTFYYSAGRNLYPDRDPAAPVWRRQGKRRRSGWYSQQQFLW
ncbi:MAG: SdrD B-like domain-containing protein [Nitrosomonadales bacterium]